MRLALPRLRFGWKYRLRARVVDLAGNKVLVANWSGGVSKNPYLSFKFRGGKAGDTLKISWVDNQGNSDSVETQVS